MNIVINTIGSISTLFALFFIIRGFIVIDGDTKFELMCSALFLISAAICFK